MVRNIGLIFNAVPEFDPVLGQHISLSTRNFDPDAPIPPGVIAVKNVYISFDPYQRGCMREPDWGTYSYPFQLGQPMVCGAVSRVVSSSTQAFQPGDLVWGMFGCEEYSVALPELMPLARKIDNPLGLDLMLFTGPLGVSGMTAYFSFYEYAKPKAGQTIYISAASGGVGQIVGQLAKMEGMIVIGSVGSDEKLNFIVDQLGFDAGFNYKKENGRNALKRLAPKGIDVYYDNVGGEHFDVALEALKDFGRIVSCGAISQYNLPPEKKYGIKNMMNLFLKRLTIQGFIVSDPELVEKYTVDFFTKMSVLLKEGKIKTKESVTQGIENAPQTYLDMFTGNNFGKAVLKVADVE